MPEAAGWVHRRLRKHISDVGAQILYVRSQAMVLTVAVGEVSRLFVAVMRTLIYNPPRRVVMVRQLYHVGYLSLPIVILTGICIGLVMAVQTHSTLSQFNGENMVGAMVNFSMATQLMPVLAGLTIAGRVGSSIAAEIGTMKVTEQIDALRVMGTDPVQYLFVPRFVACVLLMPFLTALGTFAGIFCAAYLITTIWGVDKAAYWSHAADFVDSWDILTGLFKTIIYGAIIALISCRKGMQTSGGATGVGDACTSAVVASSMAIIVATFLLTLILQKIYLLFGW